MVDPELLGVDSEIQKLSMKGDLDLGMSVLPEFGLCSLVPNRNVETEFWVKEKKNSFISLPGKGGSQQANVLMTLPHVGEDWGMVL